MKQKWDAIYHPLINPYRPRNVKKIHREQKSIFLKLPSMWFRFFRFFLRNSTKDDINGDVSDIPPPLFLGNIDFSKSIFLSFFFKFLMQKIEKIYFFFRKYREISWYFRSKSETIICKKYAFFLIICWNLGKNSISRRHILRHQFFTCRICANAALNVT